MHQLRLYKMPENKYCNLERTSITVTKTKKYKVVFMQ